MTEDPTRVTDISRKAISMPADACLVQIYGPDLGKRWPITEEELIIGRDVESGITVDLDNVSRRHCRFSTQNGKVFIEDLKSTNGTQLNDEHLSGTTALRSGDLIKIGGAIFKFLYGNNVEAQYYEEIYQLTIFDGLTQIQNKRYFLEFLEREMSRCLRYGRSLSMLMFDIDFFKKVNDTYGHPAGDVLLRELAGLVKSRVRREECFARYGGEEFVIVMPETGLEMARRFGDKLVKLVADHGFVYEGLRIPVTISVGVAEMTGDIIEPSKFIKVTDTQLYRAKHEGRNRVCG